MRVLFLLFCCIIIFPFIYSLLDINNFFDHYKSIKLNKIKSEILIDSENLEEIKSFLFNNYYNMDKKTITKLVLRIKELQTDKILNEKYK